MSCVMRNKVKVIPIMSFAFGFCKEKDIFSVTGFCNCSLNIFTICVSPSLEVKVIHDLFYFRLESQVVWGGLIYQISTIALRNFSASLFLADIQRNTALDQFKVSTYSDNFFRRVQTLGESANFTSNSGQWNGSGVKFKYKNLIVTSLSLYSRFVDFFDFSLFSNLLFEEELKSETDNAKMLLKCLALFVILNTISKITPLSCSYY